MHLGQSITSAEFRALEPIDQVYWTPEEFGAVMSDHGFVVQEGQVFEILHPGQIKSLREVVLVALSKEKAWVMSFDESAGAWKGVGTGDAGSSRLTSTLSLLSQIGGQYSSAADARPSTSRSCPGSRPTGSGRRFGPIETSIFSQAWPRF